MKIVAPFGFVTGCHAGDRHMVQATLASMRHYCPDVPICLVVDGDFDVSVLVREYKLIVLRISDLPSEQMRRLIGGNYRAKLAAMWEGPFEHYVWLDSDAIVWGNFLREIRKDVDFQIFWNEISVPKKAEEIPSWIKHFYFSVEQLKAFDQEFNWRELAYFCSGAFAAKRNSIPFSEWVKVEEWQRKSPGLFAWGEMGMLNYLVHSLSQRLKIQVTTTDLQHIWSYHGSEELNNDCLGTGWNFPDKIKRPRVAHFCGRKPLLFDFKAYSMPFTIARLAHQRSIHVGLIAWIMIYLEDIKIALSKAKWKIKKMHRRNSLKNEN